MTDSAPLKPNPHEPNPHGMVFSPVEVADHLNVSADALQRMSTRFARYLSAQTAQATPSYTSADIAALVAVQKLLAQGYDDEQINQSLTPLRKDNHKNGDQQEDEHALSALTHALSGREADMADDAFLPILSEILRTIVSNQEAILNAQGMMRDMTNVVVQDNFNLKDDNRKLRERMLEMERVVAEYQRREETRKERLEGRLRAVEGTVGALQQQLAQLVQLYRTQSKRSGWFG